MNKRNRTKYTVLGMLALSDHTGYEIVKMIESSTNYFWSESEGQIYPALALCVKEKLATCKEETSQKIQRIKKIYSITTKGRNELSNWLKKEPQATLVRNELLLKLFFGKNMEAKDNLHHVIHSQKALEEEINTFLKIRKKLIHEYNQSPHLKYWLITLDFGLRTAKAQLTWCKETIKVLESE
ncbi:MAG TPA: PadR family transcriptional regulator [Patescibacteria group bacterium]|nr:PadR family transcriptional regulator [Gammaproteobacteria bacterium]HWA52515.1 PadR family transcriptional regulator [Patescibacteria group bacterium]